MSYDMLIIGLPVFVAVRFIDLLLISDSYIAW